MARELELLALGSVKSFLKRKMSRHAPPPGAVCANCDTQLKGLYCYACGQAADNHHRSLITMIIEGFEGLFHLDGRLWRTLPPLFFNPGLLARDYMNGRIARHVPPFRTFLVSLLLFIFAAENLIHHFQHESAHSAAAEHTAPETQGAGHATKDAHAEAGKAGVNARAAVRADGKGTRNYNTRDLFAMDAAERKELAKGIVGDEAEDPNKSQVNVGKFNVQLAKAIENPGLFILSVFTWGHRLAVLLLPIMSLLLGLLYVYKRQFYIFDHFLVSCNILSFIFLTNAFGFVLPEMVRGFWFFLLILWTPVNIFMTLRGAYGSSIFGSLVKTLILWTATSVSFLVLIAGLVFIAASTMA